MPSARPGSGPYGPLLLVTILGACRSEQEFATYQQDRLMVRAFRVPSSSPTSGGPRPSYRLETTDGTRRLEPRMSSFQSGPGRFAAAGRSRGIVNTELYLVDTRKVLAQLVGRVPGFVVFGPAKGPRHWSPDGSYFVFVANSKAGDRVYVLDRSGAAPRIRSLFLAPADRRVVLRVLQWLGPKTIKFGLGSAGSSAVETWVRRSVTEPR